MRKIFQVIGLFTIICISFFVTDKAVFVLKEQDSVMIKIESVKDEYKVDSVDAVVDGKYIVPGVKGKEVDVSSSYVSIKKMGYFDSKFLVYKDIVPNVSISNTYNKYISKGNSSKNSVSLLFVLDSNVNALLDRFRDASSSVIVNYYVDVDYLNNNLKLVKELGKNNDVYNYGYMGNYSESLLTFGNNLIERNVKNNSRFCLLKKENDNVLRLCSSSSNHTVIPSIIVSNNPYNEIKNNISSGSIILMDINETVINQMPSVISFITSKGYKMVGLEELLSE